MRARFAPFLCLSASLAGAACAPAPAPDAVLLGRVWTGDSTRPWAEAVAVRGDSIVSLGDSATILGLADEKTGVIRGAFAMPGFQDDHAHFIGWGQTLAAVDLRDVSSKEEFVGRIATFARKLQPGEWILDGNWDHERLPGGRLPTRDWIDSVTPDNPVFVSRYDGHMRQPSFQNGPRLIDIDLLFYDHVVLNTPVLTLPHPRLHERGFVLLPLMDIAPEMVHPVLKKHVREMTSSCSLEGIVQVP